MRHVPDAGLGRLRLGNVGEGADVMADAPGVVVNGRNQQPFGIGFPALAAVQISPCQTP